jgi:PhnB protein
MRRDHTESGQCVAARGHMPTRVSGVASSESQQTPFSLRRSSVSPQAFGGSPATMWLYVEDTDAVFNRAVSEGATVQVPIGDQFSGDRGGP